MNINQATPRHQRTHNEQQDPKEFADTLQDAATVREHLEHVNGGIEEQKSAIHEMADSQTSWFQIKQNIKMLMNEDTFQPSGANFETFGHATWMHLRMEKQLSMAEARQKELMGMKFALLTRLEELEPDAPELRPAEEPEPTGPHGDTRHRPDYGKETIPHKND